jgi:holo-[acyl-carrier protein] synthase|tara:strand:- start:2026 stop:2421 length:396 start_codon:yes stop_codon:yes gene_type:complete
MKIFGIGTDIVNIKRMEISLKKHGFNFKNKIFSKKEISYCDKKKNSGAFYAKRFAAKEAFSKALGTGIRKGVNLKNIEISNNVQGKPLISLKGNLDSYLKKKIKGKKYDIHLSLSDDKPWAQATVIISYNK